MSVFNPSDWYYFVAGDQSRVFATARGIYVPLTDAAYLAWMAQFKRKPALMILRV